MGFERKGMESGMRIVEWGSDRIAGVVTSNGKKRDIDILRSNSRFHRKKKFTWNVYSFILSQFVDIFQCLSNISMVDVIAYICKY